MSAKQESGTENCEEQNGAGYLGFNIIITTCADAKNGLVVIVKKAASYIQDNNSINYECQEIE